MTERRAVLCVLAGALLSSTAPARAGGDDLEGLFALFAAQGERRKAFVERRYSVLFRNPPEARGTLYFKPPALLERDVVSPRKEKVRIDAETATLRIEGDDGKVTERKASLATIPQLANLVRPRDAAQELRGHDDAPLAALAHRDDTHHEDRRSGRRWRQHDQHGRRAR